MSNWNLPNGTTTRDIEEAFGGDEESDLCPHDVPLEVECPKCEEDELLAAEELEAE